MITKLNKVQKLGVFDDFVWDSAKLKDFSKCNLLYAYNGGGKTTLSNIFRLFSGVETEEQKNEIENALRTSADVRIEVEAEGKKVAYKAEKALAPIYVFNCDFITDHIYDGTTSKMKRFDTKIKSNLKDKEINELEKSIEAQQREQKASGEILDKLRLQFSTIKTTYSADFGKKINNKRLSNITIEELPAKLKSKEDLEREIDLYIQNYNISLALDQLKADLAALKGLQLQNVTIQVGNVTELLSKDIINHSSTQIRKKIETYTANNAGGGIEAWYKQAKDILARTCEEEPVACPLCDTDISAIAKTLLEEYQAYFNDAYEQFVKQLTTSIQYIPQLINRITTNTDIIGQLHSMLQKYSNKDLSSVLFETSSVTGTLQNLQQLFERKLAQINDDLIEEFDAVSFATLLDQYAKYLKIYKDAQTELISSLEKQNLDPNKLLAAIKDKYKLLILLAFDAGEGQAGNIALYFHHEQKVTNLEREIIVKESALGKARAKLKNEAKHVNRYLKALGVHHFTIDIHETKPLENIEIIFETGAKKSKLKHSISDGEKTALCLAYFLSKVQHEVIDNPETELANTIIVLDDPVTSLDENRLYTTACLIQEKLANAKQMFVLSHNLVFMKFLGNLLGHDQREDYFLSNHRGRVCLENLPYALSNYTTVYYQKLNDIYQFHAGVLPYDQGKNFIPNNIRVVLEAFLSFKLCVLNNGRRQGKNQVAGLTQLINQVRNEIAAFSKFAPVGSINHQSIVAKLTKIKQITDPQSHGSPQSIHDFNYINENELREIAEDSLNIMRFLDGMHYERAMAN